MWAIMDCAWLTSLWPITNHNKKDLCGCVGLICKLLGQMCELRLSRMTRIWVRLEWKQLFMKAADREPPWRKLEAEKHICNVTESPDGVSVSPPDGQRCQPKLLPCNNGSICYNPTWKSPMSCTHRQRTNSLCSLALLTYIVHMLASADKVHKRMWVCAWNLVLTKGNRTLSGSSQQLCVPFKAVLE